MTDAMKQRAVKALLMSHRLNSDARMLPKVYIVGNSIYWFKNAARRAAYTEHKLIEEMTIEYAYAYAHNGEQIDSRLIASNFDQRGETYGPFLFCNSSMRWEASKVKLYEQLIL